MSDKPSLFSELKRRNVLRAGALYAAGAWLLVQVATQVFPFFHIAEWVVRWIVLAAIIGFPFAIAFSWFYEWTPQGIKLESEMPPNEMVERQVGRKLDRWIIALLLLAVVLLLTNQLAGRKDQEATVAAQNSVAVLPFENLSNDKSNEYFSDGISEELLTVLQKVPGLHVAARTSAFSFKDKNVTAQEIGQKLGVTDLVEGSVRKADNSVRIAARLSRAATGEQVWSESYTRDLRDVFAVQSELAQTIVGQLRGKLEAQRAAPEIKAATRGGTSNPEAYEQFLQGRYYLNRFSIAEIRKSIGFLERACQLDPKFPLAWAALSRARGFYTGWSDKLTREQFSASLQQAREEAERALQLDPDLPEALSSRFQIQFLYDYDWKGAAATIARAQTLAPSNPVVLTGAGQVALIFDDFPRAVEFAREAVARDPVNAEVRVYLANTLFQTRHPVEARAEYIRVAEQNPAAPWAFAGQGMISLFEHKDAQALVEAKRDSTDFARLVVTSVALWNLGRKEESSAALDTMIKEDADVGAFQIAEVYGARGEMEQAFAWLERARQQQDGGLAYFPNDPLLDSLRSDPRWPAFQREMGWDPGQLK